MKKIFIFSLAVFAAGCGVESESHLGVHESPILTDGAITGAALPANTLVLTYDDGPDDQTLLIAEYLWTQGISATFFVNGKRFCRMSGGVCIDPPETGACPLGGDHWKNNKIYDEGLLDLLQLYGHTIANHTQDHCDLGGNPAYTDYEIKATQEILDRHAWGGPYLFRPPYGSWSPTTGANARSDVCLDKLIGPVTWEVDGGDWACWYNRQSVDQCVSNYVASVNARPQRNGIVLMHDRPEFNVDDPSYYSGLNNTLELTKRFVANMRAAGIRFAPIQEAVGNGKQVRNYSYCGDYSDGHGWAAQPGYYRSIHLANVDGDPNGYADVCARGVNGISCALNRGNGQFAAATPWLNADFTDALGWLPEQYGATVQLADINRDGKADVCGRGGGGILCATANAAGTAFENLRWWTSEFSDAHGWNGADSYYGSIRLADVNGDGYSDVCGRGAAGIWCALNTRTGAFAASTLWMGSDYTNAVGWLPSQYGSTIQFGDINGDQRADVCGRGGAGMLCATARTSGDGFNAPAWWTTWPDFSDNESTAGGWQTSPYFRSIRLADVSGDQRADVCGRTAHGIVCAISNGTSFGRSALMSYPSVLNAGTDYTDALGWSSDAYASTLGFGKLDADGRMDICGRGGRGLLCGLTP